MHQYKRRIIREKVLQILYAYEMNREGLQALIDGVLADVEDREDKSFAERLVNRVIIHKDSLDETIKNKIANWEMDRVAIIDKILLRMAICELMYFEEIPPKVSINECIEVAKQFSTAVSGKFINGILDAILEELKKENKIKKTGRGLIEESVFKNPKDKDDE